MANWTAFNEQVCSLYHRASNGDIQARNMLWDKVKPFLLKHYASYLRRVGIGEGDPLGFCFLAFHDAVRLYDPHRGMGFLPYCIKVLKYRLATFVFEARRSRGREITLGALLDYSESDIDPVCQEEEASSMLGVYEMMDEEDILVRVFVESLPAPASLVAIMLIEGHTPVEIMRSLNISKSSFYRTRRCLKSLLEDWI